MAFTNGAARFRMKNPSPGSCFGGFGRPGEEMVETGAALTTTTRRTPTAFISWTMARVPCEVIPASEIDRGPRADSTASVPSIAESIAAAKGGRAPARDRDQSGDAAPASCLRSITAFGGSNVAARGHEDDDGQTDGSQRSQPRQDAGRNGQHQPSSAKHLRQPDGEHQRTGQVREPGPSFQAAADDLRRAGREEEEGEEPLNAPKDEIQHILTGPP